MSRASLVAATSAVLWASLAAAGMAGPREPVIDMHIHAEHADSEGPPGQFICTPYQTWKPMDPGRGGVDAYLKSMFLTPDCPTKAKGAATDDALRQDTIALLRKYDVYALAGGDPKTVEQWRQA